MDGETLGGWTCPSGGVRNCTREEGSVHGMKEDSYVGSGHPVRVGFQLGLNAGYVCEGRADN